MDKKGKLCAAAAGLLMLPVLLAAPGRAEKEKRARFAGVNYAHRGLHTRDKSTPENSLPAFRRAAQEGYGIELDVQLTKDGQVVVFHDDTLERVCGVSGRVDAYTYAELQRFRLCGTEERIPLFGEVLAAISGCRALIVELKRGKKNAELCRKTYELLKSYEGAACIESFDPGIVFWFRRHAGEILRGQLATETEDYKDTLKRPAAFVMSRCLLNFVTKPQFIAYKLCRRPLTVRLAKWMGAMDFCWTSHAAENERKHDGVIFEFYRPRTRYKTGK